MSVRNLTSWYKLAFKLLVSDQWDVISEGVENGDQCYRWVKEQLLLALHEIEKEAFGKGLGDAASNLRDRLLLFRSPNINNEDYLPAQRRLNSPRGRFVLRDDSNSVRHRVLGAKVALLEGTFVQFDHTDRAGAIICQVFNDLCDIDQVVEAIYENKDPRLAAELKGMFDNSKEYAESMKLPVDELVELEFEPSCLPSDPPPPFKPPEIWVFGDLGNDDGFLRSPTKIQVDSEGNFLVMDEDLTGVNVETVQRIQLFNPRGKFIKVILKRGEGKVNGMSDFCLNKDGNIVVIDTDENDKARLQVFDYDANQLMSVVVDKDNPDSVARFNSLHIDSEGNMICGDPGTACVRVYGADGKLKLKFGEWGRKEGQFLNVSTVSAAGDKIYIFDNGVDKIETIVFDYNGKFICKFDSGVKHWQLEFDEKNNHFYAVQDNHTIETIGLDGKTIHNIGAYGTDLQDFWFPSGLTILEGGKIAVADKGNNRIKVVQF